MTGGVVNNTVSACWDAQSLARSAWRIAAHARRVIDDLDTKGLDRHAVEDLQTVAAMQDAIAALALRASEKAEEVEGLLRRHRRRELEDTPANTGSSAPDREDAGDEPRGHILTREP